MSDPTREAATRAVQEISKLTGHELGAGELELAVDAVVGVVQAAGNIARKRAALKGLADAALITNEEQAEEAARNRR